MFDHRFTSNTHAVLLQTLNSQQNVLWLFSINQGTPHVPFSCCKRRKKGASKSSRWNEPCGKAVEGASKDWDSKSILTCLPHHFIYAAKPLPVSKHLWSLVLCLLPQSNQSNQRQKFCGFIYLNAWTAFSLAPAVLQALRLRDPLRAGSAPTQPATHCALLMRWCFWFCYYSAACKLHEKSVNLNLCSVYTLVNLLKNIETL